MSHRLMPFSKLLTISTSTVPLTPTDTNVVGKSLGEMCPYATCSFNSAGCSAKPSVKNYIVMGCDRKKSYGALHTHTYIYIVVCICVCRRYLGRSHADVFIERRVPPFEVDPQDFPVYIDNLGHAPVPHVIAGVQTIADLSTTTTTTTATSISSIRQ